MSGSRVCILHVGGTIGMTKTPQGLQPEPGMLETYLRGMPELRDSSMPSHELHRVEPLLDSAEMTPRDWVRIAQTIVALDDDFDGFVVLHGTDTMAHTASALSFLLPGLRKPVVLTGSQLSLSHLRTDGREHIITALLIAGTLPIPEVCVYFASRLIRGNRAQKVDNHGFVAFDSGNLPPLATVGVAISVAKHLVRPPGTGLPKQVALVREPKVAAVRVFPGMTPSVLDGLLAPGLDGLVLETYGAGTFPSRQRGLLDALAGAARRDPNPVVVNCTQCHGGVVRQDTYASGRALSGVGVLSGYDMTPEAALTKLYCLLGAGESPEQTRVKMVQDLAGELDRGAALASLPQV